MKLYTSGHAVIVGVGDDLPCTVRDATGLAGILTDPRRCAYPKDQVRVLKEQEATKANIVAALENLAARTQEHPEATSIVYFSGHGIEDPDFYLVPHGFDWDNLAGTALSGAELTELLDQVRSKRLVVFFDCCHAGGQARFKNLKKHPFRRRRPSALPEEALKHFSASSGRVILASSRKHEESEAGRPYSVFTQALLEGFAGYGSAEQDGYVRVLDLALYLSRWVAGRTRDRQNPIIKVKNLEDNFALGYYAAGRKQPKSLPWADYHVHDLSPTLAPADVSILQQQLRNHQHEYMSFLSAHDAQATRLSDSDGYAQLMRLKEHIQSLENKMGILLEKSEEEKQEAEIERKTLSGTFNFGSIKGETTLLKANSDKDFDGSDVDIEGNVDTVEKGGTFIGIQLGDSPKNDSKK